MTTDLSPVYQAAGQYWNVDPQLLQSVHGVEDPTGNPTAVSGAGAIGHMQIMPTTAKALGIDPTDPTQSIFGAARVLSENLDHFGNVPDALRAYNGGWDPAKWSNAETTAYPGKVGAIYQSLQPKEAASDFGQAGSDSVPLTAPSSKDAANAVDPLAAGGSALAPANDAYSSLFGDTAPAAASPSPLAAASTPAATSSGSGGAYGALFGSTDPVAGAAAKGSWHQGTILGDIASGASSFGAGLKTAADKIGQHVANAAATVDSAIPGLQSLDNSTGLNPQQVSAAIGNTISATDAAHQGSSFYGAGQVAGDIGMTAPVMMAGGALVGGAGGALAEGLGGTAGRVVQAGTNLLTGSGAGTAVGRGVSKVASGAAQGVLGGALVNGNFQNAGTNALIGGVAAPVAALAAPLVGAAVGGVSRVGGAVLNALAPADETAANQLAGQAANDAGAAAAPVNPLTGQAASAPAAPPPVGSGAPQAPAPPPAPLPAGPNFSTPKPQTAPGVTPAAVPQSVPAVMPQQAVPPAPATPVAPQSPTASGAPNPVAAPAPPVATPQPEAAAPKVSLGLLPSVGNADTFAQKAIDHYAAGGPTQLVASQIPGVQLTMAQATGNANLARLESTMRDQNPNAFRALEAQNETARSAYAQDVVGTPEIVDAAEAARNAATSQARDAAFSNTTPTDAAATHTELQQLIDDNNGRPSVQGPLNLVQAQLQKVAPIQEDGTAPADPAQLYNVRKYLGDMVAPRAAGTANDGQAAAAQLLSLKPTLDSTIEQGAPGFQNYIQQFEQMSRPINAMQFLQSKNIVNADGVVQRGKLDSLLNAIQTQQNAPGARLADSVTPEQIQKLTILRDDMNMANRSNLGKSLGSTTAQNLFVAGKTNALMSGAGGHAATLMSSGLGLEQTGSPMGLAAGAVTKAAQMAYQNRLAAAHSAAMGSLVNKLLNPGP